MQSAGAADSLDIAMRMERARLVGLCARLTGDIDAAEDLAQETLYEAWRHERELRDPRMRSQWLAGIARNVCLRWGRRRGRELSRLVSTGHDDDADLRGSQDSLADDFDLEVELERDELAQLLDRALALLPPETRSVLIERYVEESPHAEIASRLGLSEGAVAKRLERGRLTLKRVLTNDMGAELSPYGLGQRPAGAWEETRLWCPNCGRRKLLGRFAREEGLFALRCADCHIPGTHEVTTDRSDLLAGVKGYKPALSRVVTWGREYYAWAMRERTVPCPECGTPVRLRLRMPEDGPLRDVLGVHTRCARCNRIHDISLGGLAFWTPDAQRLWRQHPRLRTLPQREIVVGGRPALLTRFESVTGSARLDVIHARDTYELLGIRGDPVG